VTTRDASLKSTISLVFVARARFGDQAEKGFFTKYVAGTVQVFNYSRVRPQPLLLCTWRGTTAVREWLPEGDGGDGCRWEIGGLDAVLEA